jgi:hypothetical protein
LAVVAASLLAAGVGQPAVGSAEARTDVATQNEVAVTAGIKAHVNSNVEFTWLYKSAYGDAHHETKLFNCFNFYYDRTENGRYHAYALNGWVSMDKAGPGWCFDE